MDSGGSFTNDRWDRSPENCTGLYEKEKSKAFFRLTRLKELVKLTVSYYKGEHYDTPAPWVKRCIEQERKRNIARWNLLAEKQTGKLDGFGF